jgi:NAD(P)H-hydrate repair Nnr-like enzyme with NAD(P)H-hydrate dehydratase domain
MDHTYWLKQGSEALFPDILWSRPESKAGSGKLAIIGGNSHGFSAPGIAYNTSLSSGAGVVRVILPDSVKKVVKGLLPDADFAASTPSGSFAKFSLNDLLSVAEWSDAVLLAGDFGRNSETAILLESFVNKYTGLLTITQDAVDYFKETPKVLVDRSNTCIVLSRGQLQKLFINTSTITPITSTMSAPQLAQALHDYSFNHPACIVTKHNDLLFVALGGQVSTTPVVNVVDANTGQTNEPKRIWRVETATKATVYWLQNPQKPFQATTTSLVTS